MQLVLLKENLKETLKITVKCCGKSVSFPILENIYLETKENLLELKATDLELGIYNYVLSKIQQKGEVLVSGNLLYQLVNSIKEDVIEIKKEKEKLIIQGKNFSTELLTQPTKDFPEIPKPKDTKKIKVSGIEFCQALSKVVQIAIPSISRPEISGVYLKITKDKIFCVATDSFRLAEKTIFQKFDIEEEYSFILPQRGVREIINTFQNTENLFLHLLPNQIFFESYFEEIDHPKTIFTLKLIDGEFPDYKEIIPKEFKTKAIIKKEDFLEQLKLALVFGGKNNEVKLKFSPKESKIEIFSTDQKIGQSKSYLEAEISGKDLEIVFNAKFLIDGVKGIDSEKLTFSLIDEENPAMIKPHEEKEDYFYILMPIKT